MGYVTNIASKMWHFICSMVTQVQLLNLSHVFMVSFLAEGFILDDIELGTESSALS